MTSPDLDGATMHFNFQLDRQHGKWVRKPLKGGRIREVELPDAAVRALERRRELQLAERAVLGLTGEYDGLVFTSETGAPLHGKPLHGKPLHGKPVLVRPPVSSRSSGL
jgi:integrase